MTLTARDYAQILGMPECYPTTEGEMGDAADDLQDKEEQRWERRLFGEDELTLHKTGRCWGTSAMCVYCWKDEPIDPTELAETSKQVTI